MITGRYTDNSTTLTTFAQQRDFVNANQSLLPKRTTAPCGHKNATNQLLAVMNESTCEDSYQEEDTLLSINATSIDIELAKCSTANCPSLEWTREKIASDLAIAIITKQKAQKNESKKVDTRSYETLDMEFPTGKSLEDNPVSNRFIAISVTVSFLILVGVITYAVIFQEKDDDNASSGSGVGNFSSFGV